MVQKRIFDILFSFFGLIILSPVITFFAIITAIDTNSSGFFTQKRVGQYGQLFKIYKLRTLHQQTKVISKLGKFLRRSKIDELPQLYNVLIADMSFVGPRPDIPGYYDTLNGEERKILLLKPGLTSEASLKYRDEDHILALQKDPLQYNDQVIFPDKVRMNLAYYRTRSFWRDLKIIFKTLFK